MQKALDFLRYHNEVAFATSDGHLPKIRIFQIMKQDGNILYLSTSTEKVVWKELIKNPNVEVLAYADNISVRCSGMVNFDVEDNVKRWIYDHNPVLPRLYSSYDQLVYFRLPAHCRDGLFRPYAYTPYLQAFRPDGRRYWRRIFR